MSLFAAIPALSLSMVGFGGIAFVVMGLLTLLSVLPSCCQGIFTGLELCIFDSKVFKFIQEILNDIVRFEIDLHMSGRHGYGIYQWAI